MPQKFESFNKLVAEGYNQISKIQSLWSGYGAIYRLKNSNGHSIVVKHIHPPSIQQHPRNWNTDKSHQRKLYSYQVEYNWYNEFQKHTDTSCKTPNLLVAANEGNEQLIILEDLAVAGYPKLPTFINADAIKVVLSWLANFHAKFINHSTQGLWEIGSYWHLETRPDEYNIMANSLLKKHAHAIDNRLNNCQYQTIIHGDAKLANFCFRNDLKKVAAVDFQYVGGGCGMKDFVYFLGSCLENDQLEIQTPQLLKYYFSELSKKLPSTIDSDSLISEWTELYPFACADFERFLLGWAPNHKKLTSFSQQMVNKVTDTLNNDYSK